MRGKGGKASGCACALCESPPDQSIQPSMNPPWERNGPSAPASNHLGTSPPHWGDELLRLACLPYTRRVPIAEDEMTSGMKRASQLFLGAVIFVGGAAAGSLYARSAAVQNRF